MSAPPPRWAALVGWLLEHRLVVLVLTVLLVLSGLSVAPFDPGLPWLERDPVPVDAIPDLGENQQIVFTEWPGRSPKDVEDQVSYPLTAALLGIPGVRTVRSMSMLGLSSQYVIFDDDVEFYWARSRVLEKLSSLPPGSLPDDVRPRLGPDATALGQVFWYTLEGRDATGRTVGGWDPDELRAIQDWTLRYALQAVDGVSEVASVGGFERELQVDVDPDAMRAAGVTLLQVADAVRRSNLDVGARTLEINGVEYLVRGRGFLEDASDLEQAVVVAREGTPIRVRDVAHVTLGPALRRGALDDEGAPAVGGVVTARYRANPAEVIAAVRDRLATLAPGLPERTLPDGTVSKVTVVPFYDRTTLIDETIGTLSSALLQQVLITALVVLVMLRDLRSTVLLSAMLPLGVLGTFVVMKATGVDANVMALGGVAIAIGTMVDLGIVFVEHIDHRLGAARGPAARRAAVRDAAAEVAPAVLTSVATTIVGFLPVLGLTSSELRLFGPLALTKTFAMTVALILSVLIVPAASLLVLRERPGAPTATSGGVLASVLRPEHARDGLLVLLGAALTSWTLPGGLLVATLGVWRLARPLVTPRTARRVTALEHGVAALAVSWLLAEHWLPLGPDAGRAANLLFVGALVGGVLGVMRGFELAYPSLLRAILAHRVAFLSLPAGLVLFGATAWLGFDAVFPFVPRTVRASAPVAAVADAFPGLGREYMPPFDEGAFLVMPTTMPHASIGEALRLLSDMDAAIAAIPEVDRVVGKLGRAETALDPAPISMFETLVTWKPEYTTDADGRRVRQWRDHIRSPRDLWDEVARAARLPGLTSAPYLMPIAARLVMLQSGMRAPMGIKVKGPDLPSIERFGLALEGALREVPALRPETVFADRVVGKPYLEIDLDREALGRYGLAVVDVQEVLQLAVGGVTLTRTVDGRERSAVRVRYAREERDSVEALERLLLPTPSGEPIPLTQVARVTYVRGPQAIRSEDTFLTSYVLFDRDPEVAEVEAVEQARAAVAARIDRGELTVPPGVSWEFAGSYESQLRSERRLAVLVPIALTFVFLLLYLQFRRVTTTLIVSSGVAVAVAGGFGLLWLYGQPWFLDVTVLGTSMRALFQVDTVHLSVAVWVGVIALVGIATDDGVVMSTWLDQAFRAAPPATVDEVRARTLEAGVRRVRPCLMTTATTVLALLPVVTSQGRGADLMVPMALPVLGGMSVELLTLFVVPVLYCALEERRLGAPDAPP